MNQENIINAVTSSLWNMKDMNHLQLEVKERLADKKLLLVLGSACWSGNCIKRKFLCGPFTLVAQGCKIIVTTDNEEQQNRNHLKLLSNEDCWLNL